MKIKIKRKVEDPAPKEVELSEDELIAQLEAELAQKKKPAKRKPRKTNKSKPARDRAEEEDVSITTRQKSGSPYMPYLQKVCKEYKDNKDVKLVLALDIGRIDILPTNDELWRISILGMNINEISISIFFHGNNDSIDPQFNIEHLKGDYILKGLKTILDIKSEYLKILSSDK